MHPSSRRTTTLKHIYILHAQLLLLLEGHEGSVVISSTPRKRCAAGIYSLTKVGILPPVVYNTISGHSWAL